MVRRILVFTHAAGYVHMATPAAAEALVALGAQHGFEVEVTDDPGRFERSIDGYDVVVFVNTSGDVLPTSAQRRTLEHYLAAGGGFVGIHAAACVPAEVVADWPWYRDLVGTAFCGHTATRAFCDGPVPDGMIARRVGSLNEAPSTAELVSARCALLTGEDAVVHLEDPQCPAIGGIVDGEVRFDEWYGFDPNPRPWVKVIATVDESTYEPHTGAMGPDHPIVWWREFGGGRSVYNAMGHSAHTWRDPGFLSAVLGGITLAAGW